MKEREDKKIMNIDATIICEKKSHKGIIIGKGGRKLKGIGKSAREDIEKMLGMKVFLTLWVKVKKDWRNSEFYLNNLE
jgi:GTP-binding protein Era